jgi:ribose 5-phosphate isomerase B
VVYLGADHRGFELKEKVKAWLQMWNIEYQDLGNDHLDPDDDYVDFAKDVAKEVAEGREQGILMCGSGHGMSIVANKFPHVRSVLVWDVDLARQGREHEGANVMVLPADYLDYGQAKKIVKVWLETKYSNDERHRRRLRKIEKIEDELLRPNLDSVSRRTT